MGDKFKKIGNIILNILLVVFFKIWVIIIKSILDYFKNIGIELFEWAKNNIKEILIFFGIIIGIILLCIFPKVTISIIGFALATMILFIMICLGVIDEWNGNYKYPYITNTLLFLLGIIFIIVYLLCLYLMYIKIWC